MENLPAFLCILNGAEVTSTSPFGEPLPNGFLALTRKPPSVRVAEPLDSIQSLAPVEIRTASSFATRSSNFLPGRPRR